MALIALVYTTIGSPVAAKTLATQIVEAQHAVCVNIIPGALSVYVWEGKVEQSQECLMLCKTPVEHASALVDFIVSQHPYTLPAILSGSVETTDAFYGFVTKTLSS